MNASPQSPVFLKFLRPNSCTNFLPADMGERQASASGPSGRAAQSAQDAALDDLPVWDLDDLYKGENAPELAADWARLESAIKAFEQDYKDKLASLNGAAWLECVKRLEEIQQIQGRIMSFAGLRYHQKSIDPMRGKFLGDCQARITDLNSALIFFELEVNSLSEEALKKAQSEEAGFARYKRVFDRMRAMKPHQLSDELEHFIHDQSVVGASAWNRLFDENMAAMRFEIDGKELALEAVLTMMSDVRRETREKATRALAQKLTGDIALYARITNTLAKEKEIEDRWRKLPSPAHSRHLANDVEAEIVSALKQAVIAAYPKISHRYYALKAGWMGLEKLEIWDRNAPLPGEDDRVIGWDEAREIVLGAYEGFDPRMKELALPFFERGWIDAALSPGKSPGAFAHPCVTNVHPYLLLNYLGKTRDVMTLAHELGHGVHQRLAARQGELLASTPLTLAETASVFGEMLTFQSLLAETGDKAAKKRLLASKVEDMINTVVRQISFYEFETRLHDARSKGELTPEQISAIWLEVSQESLGPSFNYMEGCESFWAYIPHFIHSPFYVYAYAFGDGLVNALYAVYRDGMEGFEDKYFAMLEAGGSLHHKELLAPFGLDASDPKFWERGLGMISGLIDELEAMG